MATTLTPLQAGRERAAPPTRGGLPRARKGARRESPSGTLQAAVRALRGVALVRKDEGSCRARSRIALKRGSRQSGLPQAHIGRDTTSRAFIFSSSFRTEKTKLQRSCQHRRRRSGQRIPRPQNREDEVVGNPLRRFASPRLEREGRPVRPEVGPAGAAEAQMPSELSSFRFRKLIRKETVDEVDRFSACQQHLQRRAPRGASIGSWMPQTRGRFPVIARPSGNARRGVRAGPAGPGAGGS